MKQKLFTAALALASAVPVLANEIFTIESRDTYGDHNCLYIGFDMTLVGQEGEKGNWLTHTPSKDKLPEQVYLQTLTLSFGIDGDEHTENHMGIAIFEANASGGWDYVAKSVWNEDIEHKITIKDVTFTFDEVVLNTTTRYSYFFYGDEEAFNALSTGYTMEDCWALLGDKSGAWPGTPATTEYPLVRPDVGWNDERNYGSEGAYRYSESEENESQHATHVSPVISLTVMEYIAPEVPPVVEPPVEGVPEPATATLSLLGLAGLAARRRRR